MAEGMGKVMQYQTVTQTAKRWGISPQRIRLLIKESRIPGVDRVGRDWLIPTDAEKPKDERFKELGSE